MCTFLYLKNTRFKFFRFVSGKKVRAYRAFGCGLSVSCSAVGRHMLLSCQGASQWLVLCQHSWVSIFSLSFRTHRIFCANCTYIMQCLYLLQRHAGLVTSTSPLCLVIRLITCAQVVPFGLLNKLVTAVVSLKNPSRQQG